METTSVQTYRTSDMAQATYLKMRGHDCQDVKWDGRVCYWYFFATDILLGEVDAFMNGDARIDPKEYSKIFQTTKREFYDADPSTDNAHEDGNRIR